MLENINKYKEYKYLLIYTISDLKIGLVNDNLEFIENLDEREIIEMFFFGENKQVHIFKKAESLIEHEINEDEIDKIEKEKRYTDIYIPLRKQFSDCGNNLVERKYYEYDEDGQAFYYKKRLLKISGGEIIYE